MTQYSSERSTHYTNMLHDFSIVDVIKMSCYVSFLLQTLESFPCTVFSFDL